MKYRKQWGHSMCPQCSIPEETSVHVCQCPAEKAQAVWTVSMEKLKEDLVALDTEPELLKQLMAHLMARHSRTEPSTGHTRSALAQALTAQGSIGWYNFLLGRVARQFETLQQRHYMDKDSKQTGKRWTTEVIKKLIKVAWDMWQHRNDILHNDGGNFHKKMEVAEAEVLIRAEYNTGKTTLLNADRFLLRSVCITIKMELQEKKMWLQDVVGARAAWLAKQNEPPSFDVECQRMHA